MADVMRIIRQGVGQGAFYLILAAVLGYFASLPAYTYFPADRAQIKIGFAHGAQRREQCHRRTAEELAELAPNMRKQIACPRERLPVEIELDLDGQPLYRASRPPTGLFGDGPSKVYRSFQVAPGPHRIVARLRDSDRKEGFDYERDADVTLSPLQNFAIDFRAETGGFLFR
ncbi:MAG: hypothetical protein WCF16_03330 [Alphaproteobacteria bacterium]